MQSFPTQVQRLSRLYGNRITTIVSFFFLFIVNLTYQFSFMFINLYAQKDKTKKDGNLNVIPKDKSLASLLARMPRKCVPLVTRALSPNPNHQYCLHNPFFDSFAFVFVFVWPTTDLVNFKSSTACLLNHFSVESQDCVWIIRESIYHEKKNQSRNQNYKSTK